MARGRLMHFPSAPLCRARCPIFPELSMRYEVDLFYATSAIMRLVPSIFVRAAIVLV